MPENLADHTLWTAPYNHGIDHVMILASPDRAEQAAQDLAVYGYEPADAPART